jgi:alpha-beta hydrolase superfamily lysophospholipase
VIVLLVVIFSSVVRRAQPPQPGSFYSLPSPLPEQPPGTILRSEPLDGLPSPEQGWKILYLSTLPLTQLLKIGFLKSPPWNADPWKTLLKENTPGAMKIPAPVLISQGGADPLVHPSITAAYVKHLCAMAEKVRYHVYPGVVHDAGAESAPDVTQWVADRFAGRPPSSTCP